MVYNCNDIAELLSDILNVDVSEVESIDPNDHLDRHGLVSINAIRLVSMLEEKYDFVFRDEDLLFDKFNTLNKLYDLLNTY